MGLARASFSRRLRALRISVGYDKAKDFAEALGIKEGTYNRYERGETEPNYDTLLRICQLLRTDPNFLLLGRIGE